MKNTTWYIFGALVVIFAVIFVLSNSSKPVTETATPISYKDATYLIEGITIKLVNGSAETIVDPNTSSEVITETFGNEARGDLNGDGMEDVAFLVTQQTGGTGTFYYVLGALGVPSAKGGGYTGLNGVFLGDRIAPGTMEIKNGELIVNYADRKEDEPFSASPTVGVSKYLKVLNGELAESR